MIGTKVVCRLRKVSLRILNLISRLFEDGMVTRQIPLDLIIEILSRLPAKSALRFKCVCKEWYNLINSPVFLELHHSKSLELNSQHNCILYWTNSTLYVVDDLYHPAKVKTLNWPKDTIRDRDRIYHVGSCNGLVCFKVIGSSDDTPFPLTIRRFFICNPATRTFKSIFPSTENKWGLLYNISYGFGYDSEHDDYKIVGTSYVWRRNDKDKHVFIYSLKTDLWSSLTPLTHATTERCLTIIKGAVIFGNNMLHYLVSPVVADEGSINDHKIARFDVVSEKWRDDLSLPVHMMKFLHLGRLDGRLFLQGLNFDFRSSDIWIMEEDGSWKKMFYLPQDLMWHHLIARSKERHHRFLLQDNFCGGDALKWYEQRDNTTRSLKLKPLPNDISEIVLCLASLIRIPGCSLMS